MFLTADLIASLTSDRKNIKPRVSINHLILVCFHTRVDAGGAVIFPGRGISSSRAKMWCFGVRLVFPY